MLPVIREQEPSKPSTKLSKLGSPLAPRADIDSRSESTTLASIAANRGTEPTKLTKLVRGELDWIVMKALEKDRNRLYETANGFAMDVQRYLADEPVQACPSSAGYRLRKFVRRNRGPVLSGSVVALASCKCGVGDDSEHAFANRKCRSPAPPVSKPLSRQPIPEGFDEP